MLKKIIWRDLRWRAAAAAFLASMPVALIAFGIRIPRGADYLASLDLAWFNLPGASSVFLPVAVILGAPGSLGRPRRDVSYVMSLPVSRNRWALSHIGASMSALALIAALSATAFLASAINLDANLAVGSLLARTALVFLAACAWIPPAAALTTLLRRPMFSIPVVFVLLTLPGPGRFNLDIPARASAATLSTFDPWAFADPRAWSNGFPLASISVAAVLAVAGMAALSYLIYRLDL